VHGTNVLLMLGSGPLQVPQVSMVVVPTSHAIDCRGRGSEHRPTRAKLSNEDVELMRRSKLADAQVAEVGKYYRKHPSLLIGSLSANKRHLNSYSVLK